MTICSTFWEGIGETAKALFLSANGFAFFTRLILPVLAFVIVWRCVRSMLRGRQEPEVWANLHFRRVGNCPVSHWENIIGRAKGSDIVVDFPTVSRTHATLIREEDGTWTIHNLNERAPLTVDGKKVKDSAKVVNGSTVTVGGVRGTFTVNNPAAKKAERGNKELTRRLRPRETVTLLSAFQILTAVQMVVAGIDAASVIVCFTVLVGATWAYYIIMNMLSRTGIEVELLAIFLTTIGFSVSATVAPEELYKQMFCFLAGLAVFIALGWYLRDLKRATTIQMPLLVLSVVLLLANLAFGTVLNGARNWIYIGSLSIQPSEIVKVAFIYVGTATLDKLMTKQNLYLFIGYSAFCIGMLAILGDFGTAAIFFAAFLVIAYMRSGDLTALALICAAVGFAAILAFKFTPYIASRFASWGHVWSDPHGAGFQQTRTMSAAASGGLVGVGVGNGWLSSIVAADTDLVFGILCEEWGLIIALLAVSGIGALAVFTVLSASRGRSSFYVIAACAAMTVLAFQTMLNVLGSVDILPLTGVTFPFVSNGGSSLISSWGLLAFVKAADTRRNASFANAAPRRFTVNIEDDEEKSKKVVRKAGGRK